MADQSKAIILAHSRSVLFRDLLPHVKGIMFLGTPHRGSDVAYWTRILRNLANGAFRGSLRADLLQDLERKSPVLGDICTQSVESSCGFAGSHSV
jgi:hypothetical protein